MLIYRRRVRRPNVKMLSTPLRRERPQCVFGAFIYLNIINSSTNLDLPYLGSLIKHFPKLLKVKIMLFDFVGPLLNPCHTRVASLQRSHSVKKLQNAEVRAVQTPATLCKRCGNAVQSP